MLELQTKAKRQIEIVRLYDLQGFDHSGMEEPAFALLLKEVAQALRAR